MINLSDCLLKSTDFEARVKIEANFIELLNTNCVKVTCVKKIAQIALVWGWYLQAGRAWMITDVP